MKDTAFKEVMNRFVQVVQYLWADAYDGTFNICRDIKSTAFQTFLARIQTTHAEANKIKEHKLSRDVVRGCIELDDDRFKRIVDVTYLRECLTAPSPRQTWNGFVFAVRVLSGGNCIRLHQAFSG